MEIRQNMSGSVERLQDLLDKLLLSVFEAARGHSLESEQHTLANDIKICFNAAMLEVSSLNQSTPDQQNIRIRELSTEIETSRQRIQILESCVEDLGKKVDQSLNEVITMRIVYYGVIDLVFLQELCK